MGLKTGYAKAVRAAEIKIEATSLLKLVLIVVGMVLVFGFIYYRLTPISQGIAPTSSSAQTGTNVGQVSFKNCVYFSVVTITTLGYGDFVPQGYSKAVACVEVFFGLTMMGLIVAKLTSKRLSYHVRRLFSADAQRRLDEFAADFQRLHITFGILTTKIGSVFAETPLRPGEAQGDECRIKLSETLLDFSQSSSRFRNYISYEIAQGNFFADAPVESIQKTADCVALSLFSIQQMILSFTIPARTALLNAENQRRITESLDRHKEVAALANSHSKSEDLKRAFQQLAVTCQSIPEGYFVVVPRTAAEPQQPDLALGRSDPQAAGPNEAESGTAN